MSALLLVLSLSAVFSLGMVLGAYGSQSGKLGNLSTYIASGAMAGVAFLDLLPEILEEAKGSEAIFCALFIVLGIAVLKVLDRFVPEHEGEEETEEGNLLHIGLMSAAAIVIHNIVEGMSVFSVASSSFHSGLSLALGVALHNIPMGAFIYSSLAHERKGKKVAVLLASSLSTFLGGIIMALLSSLISESFVIYLTSAALGMVLYILFWELFPSLIGKRNEWKLKAAGCLGGVLLVLLSTLLE